MRVSVAGVVDAAAERAGTPHAARRFISPLRLAGLALCLALGACQTDGSRMASSGGGGAVAFDSIDGPPQATFEKLVGQLNSEAETRRVAVASRSSGAAYRVKGYLAMHVQKGSATVAYAWDVYDRNQNRVARLSGEEPAGRVKGKVSDGWAACDDKVLARIADKSMASLAETLGVGGTAPAPVATATAAAPAAQDEKPATAEPAIRPDPAGVPVAALETSGTVLGYAAN
ncbi:hypothetical protein LJE71_10625 [Xanthobacter autotrophicus]|uniref:hypothetical protein n=1 Tax=Xanthobacter autotrophicus TaxID=280 RepID=UPI001E3B0B7A|nr:hypothetical protein [Xanthobacter autotrophicus]UDQ91411.1 hypothetical protein LJE71_10625 [Xanthobacter autotrophicus]